MANYRYLLGDILTGLTVAELPFTSATFSHVLNAPGAFAGTLSLYQPDEVATILRASLNYGRSTMYVERDGVIVWGGFLWTEEVDFDAATLTVQGEGWHSYFRRRILSSNLTYTATEQVTIAKGLLDYAQGLAGGDIGVETGTVVATGTTRDRVYLATDRGTIGQLIEQLAAVDDGFDFRYVTERNAGGILTVSFVTSYPSTGYETDLVFELGVQLSEAKATSDASGLVTNVDVIGGIIDGQSAPLTATVSDSTRYAIMPRLDDVISETDIITSSVLTAHANQRLTRGAVPVQIPTISSDPAREPKIGTYKCGDIVTVRAEVGIKSINGQYRITEYAVVVGGAGDEVANLTFANVEVF